MSGQPAPLGERQARILSQLQERSVLLAGLYALALRELGQSASAGYESARISIISHCARELMIGALDLLVDTPEPRPEPSSGSLAGNLPALLAEHSSVELRADQDLIPIPRKVAAAFADLVDASNRENGRNRRNAASLVTGSADGSHPSITEWSKAYRFFVKWAHVDKHHGGDLPNDQTLIAQLRVVEDVIQVRMSFFFDNLAAVQDILALANESDGGGA